MQSPRPPATDAPPAEDFLGARKLEPGIGLCLSGGGFRAMLFHVGALTRLNEAGLLTRLDRVASVSGGSIAAGALAVGWARLRFDGDGVASNLREEVCQPLLALAQKWVDLPAIVAGLLPFVTAAGVAARAYDRALFKGATLQDLPDRPRFTFTATSLQTGALWRFAKEYAAEYHVGQWTRPDLRVADVVAASAAFPPYMSPAYVRVPPGAIEKLDGADLHEDGYKGRLRLTDGGVYDNLGLEPIWKRYETILVSDGGRAMPGNPLPKSNWFSQALRVTDIALQQGIFLRERVLRGLVLLELWVVDAARAVGMFDTSAGGIVDSDPEVRDTSRFLNNAPQHAHTRRMRPEEAAKLLREALARIERPSGNANGGDMQVGGIYWRLAQVLGEFAAPRLEEQEGAKHAAFIRKTHGVLASAPAAGPEPDDDSDVF